MVVPVKYIVETVDLTTDDVLLPLMECIVNSIVSLQKAEQPICKGNIVVEITRGESRRNPTFDDYKTISSFRITNNGVGFDSKNYKSFETPFSQANKEYGCKGVGRFTVLAAYDEYVVNSTFKENNKWYNRSFRFTTNNELELVSYS